MKKLLRTRSQIAATFLISSVTLVSPAFAQSTKSTSPKKLGHTKKTNTEFSFPDGTPVEQIYAKCRDMIIVKIDNRFVCEARPTDSFEKIVADMRKGNLKSNPIQAGNEGDRAALRRLPDVSLEAARKAYAEQAVLIRGDGEGVYQSIVDVMDLCHKAQIHRFSLAFQPRTPGAAP